MIQGAILSDCKRYRYQLWRIWDQKKELITFIGLNPSYADVDLNDPTIIRCINFSKYWGYGGFYIINLFAVIEHKSSKLFQYDDPIGKDNDVHIRRVLKKTQLAVCIWGNKGYKHPRSNQVLQLLNNPYCIFRNKSGAPAHPLYLDGKLRLKPYSSVNNSNGS